MAASIADMADESRYALSDFVQAIVSGLTPTTDAEPVGRLSDERNAAVTSRLRALEAARQQAESASRDYHVR